MLRLLGRFLQALERHAVLLQVDVVSPGGTPSAIASTMRWSKSSPPRYVSPLVAFTLKTPSRISRIEISNVPPPRS